MAEIIVPKPCFHPSIEAAQHGMKSLEDLLYFAKRNGATGAQPSNFTLQAPACSKNPFRKAKDITKQFEDREMTLDGVSAHCPFWVHGTAWTESPTIEPFIPSDVAKLSPKDIEAWAEKYILNLLDLCVELGVFVVPMFWGILFGWELATGYPWGFWKGANYDLLKRGQERFLTKTAKIRARANRYGIYLAHEIHPGTAGMCADDFNMLVQICDGDKSLAVNADPTHCWEGEDWFTRFTKVGSRVYGCHVKNFFIKNGIPLRSMKTNFGDRGMEFVDLESGDLNMRRYVEHMVRIGYPQRYCQVMKRPTAPLVVEVESSWSALDPTSADGIGYVRNKLCFPIATQSFEDGMGA